MTRYVPQLILIVLLNGIAQLALKTGSGAMASFNDVLSSPLSILNHPYFIFGGMLYGLSLLLYVNVLSEVRLSIAYPFIGFTYVFVVLASWIVLDENITLTTAAGVILIFSGVSLLGLGLSS